MRIACLLILVALSVPCICAGDTRVPELPLLTRFEAYIDGLTAVQTPAKEQMEVNIDRSLAQLVYPNEELVLVYTQSESSGKLLQTVCSSRKGKGTPSPIDCPLSEQVDLIDRELVAVPSADGLRLWWMDETGSVRRCDTRAAKVEPNTYAADLHARVPVGVRMLEPIGDENTFGWKGRFKWLDADGGVLVDATLPVKLGAAERSPLAFRYAEKRSLWALRSFSLDEYPFPGDVPPTDISLLSVGNGRCSALETIDGSSIPLKAEKTWVVNSTLDSPAWIVGSRDVLVYRHVWSVHVGSPPHNEALYVSELWMKPVGGKARLLDMVADYAGTVGNLYWQIDQNGELIERTAGQEYFAIETYLDLQPFPALFGPKVAYLRNGKMVKMEVPK